MSLRQRNQKQQNPRVEGRNTPAERKESKQIRKWSILSVRNVLLAAGVVAAAAAYYQSIVDLPTNLLRQTRAPLPACGSGQYIVTSKRVTFLEAAPQCTSEGGTLTGLDNKNFADVSSVVFQCSGPSTAGWVKSYHGNDYAGAPMALTVGPKAGGSDRQQYHDPYFDDYFKHHFQHHFNHRANHGADNHFEYHDGVNNNSGERDRVNKQHHIYHRVHHYHGKYYRNIDHVSGNHRNNCYSAEHHEGHNRVNNSVYR
ncbi:hypothetical protein HK097_010940 [Rhizophlyctis rosea]|uniref:Uncharacterized protein n=1 Tax=Rhizophlyctis rosea TaxID=64517 RepID=A0AAD5WZH2_9FUNG|nr:hypothetical protein HK097_010940 [Rhizophlyctis rosea]